MNFGPRWDLHALHHRPVWLLDVQGHLLRHIHRMKNQDFHDLQIVQSWKNRYSPSLMMLMSPDRHSLGHPFCILFEYMRLEPGICGRTMSYFRK
jgi:hypothetical protein